MSGRAEVLGITRQAVEFIQDASYSDLPADVLRMGRRCILDGVGQYLAGCDTDAVRLVSAQVEEQGGTGEAFLLGSRGVKVPAPLAARVLGAAGHALDWDDTQMTRDPRHINGLLAHPTNTPLSAVLAVTQRIGAVSGREFMLAFQVGFEVECKISEWMLPDVYKRGFHASAAIGTFGACAAAAKLLKVTEHSLANALGIAASLSCAAIRANVGTMTKALHFGSAAEMGVTAALLGQRGLTASQNSLDGHFGYFSVFGGGLFEEKAIQGFGRTFSIVDPGVMVKPYPSGILSHQSMDATLKLITDHAISASDIQKVEFYSGSNILRPLSYSIARNHLEAKFCIPALLAMIILRRRAGRQEFSDDFIGSQQMQELQRRVETILDPAIEQKGFDKVRSRIEIVTRAGDRLIQWADERYRGGPELPMSDQELESKFEAATDGVLSETRRHNLLAAIRGIDSSEIDGPRMLISGLHE